MKIMLLCNSKHKEIRYSLYMTRRHAVQHDRRINSAYARATTFANNDEPEASQPLR